MDMSHGQQYKMALSAIRLIRGINRLRPRGYDIEGELAEIHINIGFLQAVEPYILNNAILSLQAYKYGTMPGADWFMSNRILHMKGK